MENKLFDFIEFEEAYKYILEKNFRLHNNILSKEYVNLKLKSEDLIILKNQIKEERDLIRDIVEEEILQYSISVLNLKYSQNLDQNRFPIEKNLLYSISNLRNEVIFNPDLSAVHLNYKYYFPSPVVIACKGLGFYDYIVTGYIYSDYFKNFNIKDSKILNNYLTVFNEFINIIKKYENTKELIIMARDVEDKKLIYNYFNSLESSSSDYIRLLKVFKKDPDKKVVNKNIYNILKKYL